MPWRVLTRGIPPKTVNHRHGIEVEGLHRPVRRRRLFPQFFKDFEDGFKFGAQRRRVVAGIGDAGFGRDVNKTRWSALDPENRWSSVRVFR